MFCACSSPMLLYAAMNYISKISKYCNYNYEKRHRKKYTDLCLYTEPSKKI